MPLKSQDEIHDFFNQNQRKEFIGYSTYDYRYEVDRKVNRFHLFPEDFRPAPGGMPFVRRLVRFLR